MSLITRSFPFHNLHLHQPNFIHNLRYKTQTFHYKLFQNFNTAIKLQDQTIFKKKLFTSNSLFFDNSIIVNSTEEPTKNVKENNNKKQRIEIELNEQDLIESFVKGSGNGGQKINTTSNCVDLKHIPTGIRVQCQQTRSLQQNRKIARKILVERLDNYYNDELSKYNLKKEKIRKKQSKRKKRIKEKYGDKNKFIKENEVVVVENDTNNMNDMEDFN
ncbi:RF-1 domain-containing protein [Glomus cerebriforme]|uniref:RF-1 domain-containing protein n=1 Tax=Glomus cerebriforme TaxID=658196 RepID=A0A397T5X5_9GLOM|nr:RF-1 domain-containing protein [Glomus cerebriforme]